MAQGRLERLATIPKLLATWEKFWQSARKQKSSGVDGITPSDFRENLRKNLRDTRSMLLDGYQFDALRANPVPKPSAGKDRIICVPTVRDRLTQRLVGNYLAGRQSQLGIANPASYGFLKGRGVQPARNRAIVLRRDFPWAYKSDITAFFDQIPRDALFLVIQKIVATPSLDQFLRGAINCEIDDRNPAINRRVKKAGIEANKGVRQGMPLSPFFANIILRSFDKNILASGFNLVRYADDFLILADSKSRCHEADDLCRKLLGEIELGIPYLHEEKKTTICAPDQPIDFLGLSLRPKDDGNFVLEITKRQIDKIRENLGTLKDVARLRRESSTIVHVVKNLEARISGYRSAYPKDIVNNFKYLDDTLRNERSSILTHLFSEMFGNDVVVKLNKWQKEFLLISPSKET